MKLFLSLIASSLLLLSTTKCNSDKNQPGVYKGILQVKGICSNYTISVIEGNIDKSLIEISWTDEHTKKNYSNAFGLGSVCNFLEKLNEGDEFYFKIDTAYKETCNVCMAYYPTPVKKLSIKVINK